MTRQPASPLPMSPGSAIQAGRLAGWHAIKVIFFLGGTSPESPLNTRPFGRATPGRIGSLLGRNQPYMESASQLTRPCDPPQLGQTQPCRLALKYRQAGRLAVRQGYLSLAVRRLGPHQTHGHLTVRHLVDLVASLAKTNLINSASQPWPWPSIPVCQSRTLGV